MLSRGKELLLALLIYVVTMTVLLMAVYRFLENWHLSQFNFFIAGVLVLFVAVGWGYILTAMIFAPKEQMEHRLTTLSHDILHELNIPLSTIQANASMLKKTMTDEKSFKRIERIEDASVRLEKLYHELVYAIRKEMHEIEKEIFDIQEVIQERVAVFLEQQRNPIEITTETYHIKADKIGFEQMLDNIISNAMKYSEKEAPVHISLEKDILKIQDEGKGMSPTELLQVHERYYQADAKQEGKGIGLALVKDYCDTEGIGLQIHSEKEVGTQVYLDLSKVHNSFTLLE